MRILATAVAFLLAAGTVAAADLKIRVIDIRSAEGNVHIALYDTPSRFPKPDGLREDAVIKAAGGEISAVFRDLPPGLYAAATYHDENGNGRFDQGLLGIPLEGFAFSNDARPSLAPPSFGAAAVPVPPDGSEVLIRMRY